MSFNEFTETHHDTPLLISTMDIYSQLIVEYIYSESKRKQKMATRTPTNETTPDLKTLLEQKRLLDAQLKAAREAMPKLTKLELLIDRQNSSLTKWIPETLAIRVQKRVALGQPLDEAMNEVFAVYRAAVEQLIAHATTENEAE
jgi:hypothetical protein